MFLLLLNSLSISYLILCFPIRIIVVLLQKSLHWLTFLLNIFRMRMLINNTFLIFI